MAARVLAVPPRGRGHLLPGRALRPRPRATRRVDPLHARKMAAALQWATVVPGGATRSCSTRRGEPVTASASRCSKQADELADVLAVLQLAAG